MKSLTINQTMDLILTYTDGIKPGQAPEFLRNELAHLRKLKMAHPKGGLLPYPKGESIKRFIEISSPTFGFIQNFNSAQAFKNNKLKTAAV